MRWTAAERRWRDALLEAMIPAHEGLPAFASLDLAPFWTQYEETAPPLLQLGFRAAVWILTWLPLASTTPRAFHRQTPTDRDALLTRYNESIYLLRQLVVTVKLIACLAYFNNPEARAAVDARSRPTGLLNLYRGEP